MLDAQFLKKIKQQICAEMDTLNSNQRSREESSQTVELDQASTGRLTRMDAMQQQAMAQENLRRANNKIQQLQAALQRIENEDYGYCIYCDEEITSGRLFANPISTLCIDCAQKQEDDLI